VPLLHVTRSGPRGIAEPSVPTRLRREVDTPAREDVASAENRRPKRFDPQDARRGGSACH